MRAVSISIPEQSRRSATKGGKDFAYRQKKLRESRDVLVNEYASVDDSNPKRVFLLLRGKLLNDLLTSPGIKGRPRGSRGIRVSSTTSRVKQLFGRNGEARKTP